jgi:ATP-binding cassette subfamily B protein
MLEIFDMKSSLNLDPSPIKDFQIQNGEIQLKNIHFTYDQDTKVFHNLNLHIKPGEKVGIVGHSGSGKSTLIKLLLRLMDPIQGQVLFDKQDIQKLDLDLFRSQISYVPQQPMLFHRTIFENISYANPTATKEQVIAVAKKAHAHEFISKLPKGYNSLVGERGIKLSGGERQRIAIARAMLEPNKVLLLDEATSALDSISEKYIQDSFQKLMQNRTTIVIAHRLSTIQQLDRIIVMEDGKIVEDGSHQELLKKKGTYHHLWSHQNDGFIQD